MKHKTKMSTADKRNNVLLVRIDKVALAARLGVTPSYVRQLLNRKRNNPDQLGKITRIIEAELPKLTFDPFCNGRFSGVRIEVEIRGIKWKNK